MYIMYVLYMYAMCTICHVYVWGPPLITYAARGRGTYKNVGGGSDNMYKCIYNEWKTPIACM